MYYKTIKSNLTFNEAIDSFKNGNIIKLKSLIFDPKDININEVKFYIEQIESNDWEVIDVDYDKMDKLNEIRDIMHCINPNIDSRLYPDNNMHISSYWNLFNRQFIIGNEDLQFEIMKNYYEKRLQEYI